MKIKNIFFAAVAFAFLSACSASTPQPTMAPLELQSLQSREYEAAKEIVFPSVISVFQDIGYTISHADFHTGLISAESSSSSDFGTAASFWSGKVNVKQTKATAFIERIGDKTIARLSFVEVKNTSFEFGLTDRQDTPLLNAQLYQNAFEKVENAIFIRSQN